MNRTERIRLAEETVAIQTTGNYRFGGKTIDISEDVQRCLQDTRLLRPSDWNSILRDGRAIPDSAHPAKIEMTDETTLSAAHRLIERENIPRVLALNFASAKNPGGGFLNGSQAQEESLARASALYNSLRQGEEYYQQNRRNRSLLYLDYAIFSPNVPVFRNE